MVELRVHDINVVADLSRHNSTATDSDDLVVYDRISNGNTEEDIPAIDGMTVEEVWASVMLSMAPYWTLKWNWWPVLVFPIVFTRPSFVVDIRIGADLL